LNLPRPSLISHVAQWAGLALAVGALGLLAACPQEGGGGEPAAKVPGAQLYAQRRCGICHGDNREGKPLAPPLKGLAQHWTADELVYKYFPDPVAYQNNNPRLSKMLEQYSSMKMPPVLGDPAELRVLAEWLLTEP
jgi:hypothetical protein